MTMKTRKKEKTFTKAEVTNVVLSRCKANISDVAIYKRINKMIASGTLSRVGNGQYAFDAKKRFDYSLENATALNVLSKLEDRLGQSAKYILYETTVLNAFLNHLIGRSTVIAEVERGLAEPVFWFLKEEGFDNVMLNPSENENYMYNPYDGSGVIIKTMVSKSPIDNKCHKLTIEKLVVDIVCDKTLNMFYEGDEVSHMVKDILNNYMVKFDSIRNYAKRRHGFDRFIEHVPADLKGAFYD